MNLWMQLENAEVGDTQPLDAVIDAIRNETVEVITAPLSD